MWALRLFRPGYYRNSREKYLTLEITRRLNSLRVPVTEAPIRRVTDMLGEYTKYILRMRVPQKLNISIIESYFFVPFVTVLRYGCKYSSLCLGMHME